MRRGGAAALLEAAGAGRLPAAGRVAVGGGGLQLFVDCLEGAPAISLELSPDAAVADVEEAVAEARGLGMHAVRGSLQWQGEALRDPTAPLADLGVGSEATLTLARTEEWVFDRCGPRLRLEDNGHTVENTAERQGDLNQFAMSNFAMRCGVHTWRICVPEMCPTEIGHCMIGLCKESHPIGRACGRWGPDAWFYVVCNHIFYKNCNWRIAAEADRQVRVAHSGKWEGKLSPGSVVAVEMDCDRRTLRLALDGQLSSPDPICTELPDEALVPMVGFMSAADGERLTVAPATPEDIQVFRQ